MEWKEVYIKDICTVLGDGLHGTPEYDEKGDFYFINGNNLQEGHITIKKDTKRVSQKEFLKYQKELNDRTILVSINGTIGNVAKYNNEPCILGKSACFFNVKEDIDRNFIYYVISSPHFKKSIIQQATGTTIKNVSLKQMRDYHFLIPVNLSDQRKIAGILSALDSKIENNNKINANLESQAQALFKSWFVDFTPFKDQPFVDSELGSIPQGLKICQISDISHTLETGRRQKGGAVYEGIPSVGAEHVKGMGTYDYSKTKYISSEFANKLKTGKINGYELLIYKDGGKPGYFIPNFSIFGEGYPFDLCYLNEHVFKLDFLQNKGYNIFNYFQFKTNYVMSFLNAQGGKAAIPGINKKDIECIYTFAPNNPKVVEFGNFALPLFTKILRNCVENQRLAALRDTLLPKLMSGEIKL